MATVTLQAMTQESVWLDQFLVENAETRYQMKKSGIALGGGDVSVPRPSGSGMKKQIADARKEIQQTLSGSKVALGGDSSEVIQRVASLEKKYDQIIALLKKLESRCDGLEGRISNALATPTISSSAGASATDKPEQNGKAEDSDDDVDLFGSDDDEPDEEAERLKEERLAAYAAKKSKKPGVVAKSNIILDVKPWDDETDMGELEAAVRAISADGLLWGASKLVPLAYGIKKLQISCVVEDDKISTDWLEEEITAIEDFVQSMDIAAFNKI